MSVYKPPLSFNVNKPAEWKSWRTSFVAFRSLSRLNVEEADYQICSVNYVMGMPASENIYDQFVDKIEVTLENVLAEYDHYFQPSKNLIYLRAQGPEETIEQYFQNLHILAKNCDFSVDEAKIRDRMVVDLYGEAPSDRLQLENDLTLNKEIELATQFEQLHMQKKQRVEDNAAN